MTVVKNQVKASLLHAPSPTDRCVAHPLHQAIDYMGHRVMATAIIPVGPNCIVSGTPDGTRTVFTPAMYAADSESCEDLVEAVANSLHLARHEVASKQLWHAADACLCRSPVDGRKCA